MPDTRRPLGFIQEACENEAVIHAEEEGVTGRKGEGTTGKKPRGEGPGREAGHLGRRTGWEGLG